MPVARLWYVSCSPRSPAKIAPELVELAKLEGVNWRERDETGFQIHQVAFANSLKKLGSFEGSISVRDPAFSARDRFAPMQTYGFAFVDNAGILHITPAGHRLINGERVQELFLKQMLKWQYPSWQHGGNPKTRHLYMPPDQMSVFPFVETLRVCREVGGLSKYEMAIFLLPALDRLEIARAIQSIKKFRTQCKNLRGRARLDFVHDAHKKQFQRVYAHEIAAGEFSTRESVTLTADKFLEKKVRNSIDVADAAIRYFRSTGLFTLSADFHGLAISSIRRDQVDQILDKMKFEIVGCYNEVDQFYSHMGNSDTPVLPWESQNQLMSIAITLGVPKRAVQHLSATQLKKVIEQREEENKQARLSEYAVRVQEAEASQDIIAMFNRICQRDVIDPPLFLEWNTWRALASMDDYHQIRNNFTLDDDLQPFSTAPGNKADIEVEYNDTFVTLVEVTLQGGQRQYDTEGEPVTRHIGRFQFQEQQKAKPRAVYGLFIAPSINPATRHYFYVHMKHMANPDFGGYLNIIPLTVNQFVDVFKFCKIQPDFHRGVVRDLLDRVVALKSASDNADEWGQQFPAVIQSWKDNWQLRP